MIIPDASYTFVVTNNARGNLKVSITGTLPDGAALPAKAQHYTLESTVGYACAYGIDDFKGVTTPSGQFSVICRLP